jgi:predicted amidohydrolase
MTNFSLRFALAQFEATDDKQTNLSTAIAAIRQGAADGAELVLLHELVTTQYFPAFEIDDAWFSTAEPADGSSVTAVQNVAKETQTAVLMPWFEALPGSRFVNSAALIDREGEIRHIWRKTHIPRVQVPAADGRTGFVQVDEKYYFEPWLHAPAVVSWHGIGIGTLICHDRHFPEAARSLALRGAGVILVPSTSRGIPEVVDPVDAWRVELRALALQNMCFVAATNRTGLEQGQRFAGHSMVCGPGGDVEASLSDASGHLVIEIDLSAVERTRIARGFFRDRRPDTYGALVEG